MNDSEKSLNHPLKNESDMSGYVAIAREHVKGTDEILYELEVCIGELNGHCETLLQAELTQRHAEASGEARSQCVQGTYLVKSLQNKQSKLKELLDIIDQPRES